MKPFQLTRNFWLHEFLCKCATCRAAAAPLPATVGDRVVSSTEILQSITYLAQHLQRNLRDPLNKPIAIISGLRCPAHNAAVGGAKESLHLLGKAADLQVYGYDGLYLEGYAQARIDLGMLPDGGLGTYVSKPATLHYDTRGTRARWRKP